MLVALAWCRFSYTLTLSRSWQLEVYHGWLLKKIFGKVISSSPSRESFAEKLAPQVIESMRRMVVDRDMATFCKKLKPVLGQWKSVYAELDLEDVRKV